MVEVLLGVPTTGRVRADDDVWLEATDLAHEVAAELNGAREQAVFVAEEDYLLDTQHASRGLLLDPPHFRQRSGALADIARPFVAAGAEDVDDLFPLADPPGDGTGRAELGIVGVGHDDHRAPSFGTGL